MTVTAGYSGTPLPKKLGLKDGQRALFIGLPVDLEELTASRDFVEVRQSGWDGWDDQSHWDFVHGFTTRRSDLEAHAEPLKRAIAPDGMVWVSWPKRASKVETDITEDTIREVMLPIGLVDVKVAAVSDIWSGLKLVIRKELRG